MLAPLDPAMDVSEKAINSSMQIQTALGIVEKSNKVVGEVRESLVDLLRSFDIGTVSDKLNETEVWKDINNSIVELSPISTQLLDRYVIKFILE